MTNENQGGAKAVKVPPMTADQRAFIEPLINPVPVDLNTVVGGPRKALSPSEQPEPVAWRYCPECGSDEIRYERGGCKQCKGCGQEWFADIDYSDVVQKNLARFYAQPSEQTLRTAAQEVVIILQSDDPLSVQEGALERLIAALGESL